MAARKKRKRKRDGEQREGKEVVARKKRKRKREGEQREGKEIVALKERGCDGRGKGKRKSRWWLGKREGVMEEEK